MLSYVTIGTNDLKGAGEFYDAVLGVIGGKRSQEGERMISGRASPARGRLPSSRLSTRVRRPLATARCSLSMRAIRRPSRRCTPRRSRWAARTTARQDRAAPADSMAATSATGTATSWSRSADRKQNRIATGFVAELNLDASVPDFPDFQTDRYNTTRSDLGMLICTEY